MKQLVIILFMSAFFAACGGNTDSNTSTAESSSSDSKKSETGNPSYDPERGEGKFTKVEVGEKLDVAKAAAGEKVYGVKCSSCHKLTSEKLVGPGWLGATDRHTAE